MITVIGEGIDLEDLEKIEPVPPLLVGKRWRPVKHIDLVNTIKAEVKARGWVVADEKYAIARNGADMAGAFVFRSVTRLQEMPGMQFALGFLNSNARRKALTLTVGARIGCCTNGLCTGTILMSRYHDETLDLTAQIKDALDQYEDNAKGIPAMVKKMQKTEMNPGAAANYILEAGRRGWIGAAAVMRVDKEYNDPTYPEHGSGTAWALLNAFTYAARPNIAPIRQMEVFDDFRKMVMGDADGKV